MALTPPLFSSPYTNVDATKFGPTHWDRVVTLLNAVFDGADAHGSLLFRDTANTTKGSSYLTPVAAGQVLVSAGVNTPPAWSAAPLVTSLSLLDTGQPSGVLSMAAAGVLSFSTSGGERLRLDSSGHLFVPSSGQIIWTNGAPSGTPETALLRDAANTLALRNGANAQALYLYNTFTDASNFRRLKIVASGSQADITTDWAGTGTAWDLRIENSWIFAGSTGHLLAAADGSKDIGASGANRPRFIYTTNNVTVGGQIIANGGQLGYSESVAWGGSAAPALRAFAVPRDPDWGSLVFGDYLDEYALIDLKGAIVTFSTALASGAASDMFRDDANSANWGAGLVGGSLTITIDHTATNAVIPNRNNGSYRVGLTFRSTGDIPTHIKLEAWNTAAGGSFATVYDADVAGLAGFAAWISPSFVSPDAAFNMYKTRITLSGFASPTTGTIRMQRVLLYHDTAPWDPWHLHAKGGSLWGALTFGNDNSYDIGAAGATRPRSIFVGTSLQIGSNPAVSGGVRLPNNNAIVARNAANSGDLNLLYLDASNVVSIGDTATLSLIATDIKWGKALVALGGGATPTLGTIGGTGPATAAQNSWMRVLDSAGAAFWVPAWK